MNHTMQSGQLTSAPVVAAGAEPADGCRVRVVEDISEQLAGVPGCRYDSLPQTRANALALVRMLIGSDPDPACRHWERPIAGGQRSVDLLF